MISNMADSLKDESWYVQALASKLIPVIEKATKAEGVTSKALDLGMGLRK